MIASLPVLMYHSVAPPVALKPHNWLRNISVPVDLFEMSLADWSRRGVATVGSEDLMDHLTARRFLPPRSVMLTFDDGYLDNWVAVLPLLRKYDKRAVVFMSTDFIDPRPGARPTLDDVGKNLTWQGYLSRDELRAMVESGRVEIGSHARSHTWYFTSSRIIDFYSPYWNIEHAKCRYRFLWLNEHPEQKFAALQHLNREAVPWGTPVYEFAPALVAQRFHPDETLKERLVETVARKGGERFFQRPDWRADLEAVVDRHRREFGERGVLETEEERQARLREELATSRSLLEEITGKPVRFFSPPQGAIDAKTYRLARECGYELVTAPSSSGLRMNRYGAGLGWVYRCGTGYSLFGRRVSSLLALRSQRIVTARAAGRPAALLVTKLVGAMRAAGRILPRGRRPAPGPRARTAL